MAQTYHIQWRIYNEIHTVRSFSVQSDLKRKYCQTFAHVPVSRNLYPVQAHKEHPTMCAAMPQF